MTPSPVLAAGWWPIAPVGTAALAAFGVLLVAAWSARSGLAPGRRPSACVAARHHLLRRRRPDGGEDLGAFADAIARDVRIGRSLPAAVDDALRARPACLPGVARLRLGGATLATALAAAVADPTPPARRGGRPRGALTADEQLVVQTLSACVRSGGHLATPLERAATVLRERRAWQQERRAQGAQARLSAAVMTLLPLAFAAWGAFADRQVRDAYVSVPLVGVCGVVGVALNAIGWCWMRRLVGGRSP